MLFKRNKAKEADKKLTWEDGYIAGFSRGVDVGMRLTDQVITKVRGKAIDDTLTRLRSNGNKV